MNLLEGMVNVDYYIQKAGVKYLTPLEITHVVEFFEFVSESVLDAVTTLDLNTPECIEDVTNLLWTFKDLQGTLTVS